MSVLWPDLISSERAPVEMIHRALVDITWLVVHGPRTLAVGGALLRRVCRVTRSVTFELTARYSGSELQEAGSIPFVFSNWNIKGPGWQLQSHGVVEFLLVVHRGDRTVTPALFT
jgi:hypothetical protein